MKKMFTLLLLSISISTHAQHQEPDSLRLAVENHPEGDTVRFRLLMSMGDNLIANPVESKSYIEQALALAKDLEFGKGIAEAYCSLAYYYWDRMEYALAIENGLTALRTYENLNDVNGLYETYSILAAVYSSLKDPDRSNAYMNKMLELGESNKDLVDNMTLYFNLGFMKLKQSKLEEGIDLINKALTIAMERNDHYTQASCYTLLGRAHELSEDTEAALINFKNAIEATCGDNHPNTLGNTAAAHEGLGAIYMRLKNYAYALSHLDTALVAAKQIKSANIIIKVYHNTALLYEIQGDFRKALRYERLKNALNDSIFNQEKSHQLAEVQTRYETEKKEQTIALLEQQQQYQRKLSNFLIAGISLLGLSAIIIIMLQRSRSRKSRALLDLQQSANAKLVEVDQLKSRFFASISHEFRTPLTLILGPVEEKLARHPLGDNDKIIFQTIRRSANRLLELINQLLELSKLESGYLKLQPEPCHLQNTLLLILSSFDSLADVNQVRYTKDVFISDKPVLADRDKLEKILSNLLSNAFKFTPQNGLVALRALSIEKEDFVELQVQVQNTGTVIPAENLARIFDSFFQGETTTYLNIQGSGLGLSLVKELVKLHHGHVEVTSDTEKGTVFSVLLQFKHATVPVTDVIPPKVKNTMRDIFGFMDETEENVNVSDLMGEPDEREIVLIVEDSAEVRAFVRSVLENNYTVIEAAHGVEGLQVAIARLPHIVIADVMMPKMNGIDLSQQLKSNEKTSHIPVILLTARADHESKLEGLRTGADDYLIKPFNSDELRARVTNLIEQRRKLAQKYHQQIVIQPHEIAVSSLDEQFMRKIIAVVESNIENTQFNVDVLTTAVGMSRTNLHRKLKALTGLSTTEFIQDFRLRRAAQLIEKKANTIAQIAYEVGFNDQSYFTKCFKKKFGKTPSGFAEHL